ncbi:Transcription factor IIIA [Tieghemiomyces parasiticus]|uniref:Transcription factor IIIA n=1 Tax=Tieghemiomyces parasiticus TaxID=78921 RepID=A0A9W7ZWV9_9FUNG|nr:Transcription factor IIIA [Tieghemiomyces parasiticus]
MIAADRPQPSTIPTPAGSPTAGWSPLPSAIVEFPPDESQGIDGAAASLPATPCSRPLSRRNSTRADGKGRRRPYKCNHDGCTKAFHCQTLLDQHVNTHTGDVLYRCPEPGCDKGFNKKQNLQNHMYHHLPYEARPYPCDHSHCTARFYDSYSLNKHRRIHDDPKPFKCTAEGCHLAFAKKFQLTRHTSEHTGQLPHICDHPGCDRSFKYPSYLRKHKLDHAVATAVAALAAGGTSNAAGEADTSEESPAPIVLLPPRYLCAHQDCGRGFFKWSELRAHVTADHPHRCVPCDRVFSTRQALRRHTDSAHGPPPTRLPCPWPGCTQQLRSHKTLQNHVRAVHEKAKLFACQLDGCSERFASKLSLDKHYRGEHGVIKEEGRKGEFRPATEADDPPPVPARPRLKRTRTQTDDDSDFRGKDSPCRRLRSSSLPSTSITSAAPPLSVITTAALPVAKLPTPPSPSIGEILTGYDFANVEATGRQFPCPVPNCPYAYVRKGNLNYHLAYTHTIEERSAALTAEFDWSVEGEPSLLEKV